MELIDRQAFLKNKVWNCGGSLYDPYYNGYSDALDRVQEVLEAAPTVDAVPVVRCKDCKHRRGDFFGTFVCRLHKGLAMVTDESFCSYGERKDDGICKED